MIKERTDVVMRPQVKVDFDEGDSLPRFQIVDEQFKCLAVCPNGVVASLSMLWKVCQKEIPDDGEQPVF